MDEIARYISEPVIDDAVDPLGWCKENAYRFPKLSKLARDVLGMPASTVVSESAFSGSGRVITDYRSRLKPETVSLAVLIEVNSWMHVQYKLLMNGKFLTGSII